MSEHGLSAVRLAEIKETYGLFDAEGVGYVPAEDLGSLLRALGFNPSVFSVQDIVTQRKLTQVTFPELLAIVAALPQDSTLIADLVTAFSAFTDTGDGFIDVENLRIVLTGSQEPLSEKEVALLLEEATIEDGRVHIESFAKLLVK